MEGDLKGFLGEDGMGRSADEGPSSDGTSNFAWASMRIGLGFRDSRLGTIPTLNHEQRSCGLEDGPSVVVEMPLHQILLVALGACRCEIRDPIPINTSPKARNNSPHQLPSAENDQEISRDANDDLFVGTNG